MFGSIINRLILLELVKVFLLALTGLTGLFLIAGLLQEASQRGLSLVQVISIIPYIIPSMLPFTIPATTLFATCVVYGRMSHDNELIVLKTAGVNILHVLKPAMLLGTFSAATTMLLYYDLIPRSQRLLRERVLSDAEEVLYGVIKREGGLRQPGMSYVMYVREVQGKRLLDVIFKKRSATGTGYEIVARTREARLKVDLANNQVEVDMGRCTVVGEKDGVGDYVTDRVFPFPLPDSLTGNTNKNRTGALTWEELRARRAELVQEMSEIQTRRAELTSRPLGPTATPEELTGYNSQIANLEFESLHKARVVRNVEVELQLRPVLAIGCICFVLIGCPVGIWASRSDYLSIFVICFLPTLFAYYPLLLAGMNLAKEGKIAAEIGVWACNVFLGGAAVVLITRLLRR